MKNTSNSNNEFSAAAYAYELPPELIAQTPVVRREDSRLLILNRRTGAPEHRFFRDIPKYLTDKDLLVFNDTRVFPARLIGRKNTTGARCEVFLLKQLTAQNWSALVKPGRRLPAGSVVSFAGDFSAEILEVLADGRCTVALKYTGDLFTVLERYGQTPLPPYIKTDASSVRNIRERYQTVYARETGSSAAPTAGLHFSAELLAEIKARGIPIAFVTLHIGLGTFQPLKTADIREHQIHTEEYYVPAAAMQAVRDCRARGGRVIAVGTTAARVLETAADSVSAEPSAPLHGQTSIYIYPGYQFKAVDALITNFHLPCSTLLLLVSALAGREKILAAYQEAIKQKYRFFSFGDAMFII